MEEKNEEDLPEDEVNNHNLNYNDYEIDNLIIENVDSNRIKVIDQTKKRAVLESVIDKRTEFQINKLIQKGILDEIHGIISAGKEANVYLGYQDEKEVAIKIYKIDSNTSKWMRNYIIGDPRYKKIPKNITKIIYLWASKEYKNLKRARKVGLTVPEPIYVINNILIMEYIGFGGIPAPKLKDIQEISHLEVVGEKILNFILDLYQKARLVHADLSEFNILYHNKNPIVIDISQAISIDHPKAELYLVRDIRNVFSYFENKNLSLPDPSEFYYKVINM